jgi:hypothetical protein
MHYPQPNITKLKQYWIQMKEFIILLQCIHIVMVSKRQIDLEHKQTQ